MELRYCVYTQIWIQACLTGIARPANWNQETFEVKLLATGYTAVMILLFSSIDSRSDWGGPGCKEVTNKTISPGQRLAHMWEVPTHTIKAGLDLRQLHEDVNRILIICNFSRKVEINNHLYINLEELQTIPSQVEIPMCFSPQYGTGQTLTWKCILFLENKKSQTETGSAIPSSTADSQWYQSAPGTILVAELEGYQNPEPPEVTPILVAPPATVADPDGG
jgi:hypothetical protein